MRLIKPQKIGYLQYSYGHGKDLYYVASPILFFDLLSGQVQVEHQQWNRVLTELNSQALDFGLPKTCGEFLLAGHGYAPKPHCDKFEVSVQVAKQKRSLTVFGQRHWRHTMLRGTCPSFAKEIEQPVALTWQNALGGEKSKLNPLGMGFSKDSSPPRVELENTYIDSTGSKYRPASFLPMPITWPQRAKYQGNYKGDWFTRYFPAFSPSTDLRLFNSADQGQQLKGYFAGDECFTLTNLHPQQPELTGQLPKIRARAFINAKEQLSELPLQLDTVWFLPNLNLGALIFRGQMPVLSTDALEISDVLLAYENMADAPRPASHYIKVFALRTQADTALANAMNEAQLSPAVSEEQRAERQAKVAAQRQQKIADFKAYQQKLITSTGGKIGIPASELPEPELTPADDILEEDLQSGNIDLTPLLAHAHSKSAEADAAAEQKLAELQARYPQHDKENALSAEQAQQNLSDLHPPESQQQQALLSQQMTIQTGDSIKVEPNASTHIRQQVTQRAAKDGNLACLNMTGADLSGLNFNGTNFREAILSFANLSNCVFTDCDFSCAALVNANLTGCQFQNCNMQAAQFSGARAQGLIVRDCQIPKILWRNAHLTSSQFTNCTFSAATILNNHLDHSRFTGCKFENCTINQSRFSDCDFAQCAFTSSVFSETSLACSRWLECSVSRTVMQLCKMQVNTFTKVTAHKWLFSTEVDLTCSTWIASRCEQSNYRSSAAQRLRMFDNQWRDCDLSLADFTQASLHRSQLIGCIAAQSNFTDAQLVQCNLYKSRFRGAQFAHCQWQACNFLGADLMWAQLQDCRISKCMNFSKVAVRDLYAQGQKIKGGNYAAG